MSHGGVHDASGTPGGSRKGRERNRKSKGLAPKQSKGYGLTDGVGYPAYLADTKYGARMPAMPDYPTLNQLRSVTSVQLINDDRTPDGTVRAAVTLAMADKVGVGTRFWQMLTRKGAEAYAVTGDRLDDIAMLNAIVILPENEGVSFVEEVKAFRTDSTPGHGLRTNERRAMSLYQVRLSTSNGRGNEVGKISAIISDAGFNTRTLELHSHPVPGPGAYWEEPRVTVIKICVEVEPAEYDSWLAVADSLREWAKKHRWTMPEPELVE